MEKVEQLRIREVAKQQITAMFLIEYLPKVNDELARFVDQSAQKIGMLNEISSIVGRPVSGQVGELKIAKPTQEIIEKLADVVVHYASETYGKETEKK